MNNPRITRAEIKFDGHGMELELHGDEGGHMVVLLSAEGWLDCLAGDLVMHRLRQIARDIVKPLAAEQKKEQGE